MRRVRLVLAAVLVALATATAASGFCFHCRWEGILVGWYCDPNGVQEEEGYSYCAIEDLQCVHGPVNCHAK